MSIAAQIARHRRQARWEPWKALAAIFVAGALFIGSVFAIASWWPPPQTINMRITVN
jgi:CHASE2 domain-containing sensor protein